MLDYKRLFEQVQELYLGTTEVITDLESQIFYSNSKIKKLEDEITCLKLKS